MIDFKRERVRAILDNGVRFHGQLEQPQPEPFAAPEPAAAAPAAFASGFVLPAAARNAASVGY
jgi:hypothetical protein